MQQTSGPVSRRVFIQVAGGAGAGLLATACSVSAPAISSTSAPAPAGPTSPPPTVAVLSTPAAAPTAPLIGAAASSSVLPNYFPPAFAAPPDHDAHDPRVTLGWDNYPKNPPVSWSRAAPGSGSNITAFIVDYYPPPTPYDSNPTWQAVNKALNANFQMIQVNSGDYPLKMATLMAGNDLPDIMHLYMGITGPYVPPGTAEFLKSQCQDLAPYLAGDAVKDYPNLAAIPTYSWTNSACAIDGALYSWPLHRYLPGLAYFFKNADMWNAKIGADVSPRDAADLKKILTELSDPSNGVWAMGGVVSGVGGSNLGIGGYASLFGAPNTWGLDNSGQIVRDRETDQYKAAVGYLRDLWSSGLFWPDAPTSQDGRSNFVAKKFAMCVEGFGNPWNDFWLRGLQQNPPTNFDLILPFSADASTKVQSYIMGGYNSTNVMKKASPDRVRELLRVVDYLAKPFGTQEDLLIGYGLSPADYAIGADGNPVLTSDGKTRSQYVPWQYLADRPYAQYYAGIPNYAGHVFDVERVLVDQKVAVADATLGYYSPTATASVGKQAERTWQDGLTNIILGRDALGSYDQLVKDWQNTAGNKIKQEYNTAIAQGHQAGIDRGI